MEKYHFYNSINDKTTSLENSAILRGLKVFQMLLKEVFFFFNIPITHPIFSILGTKDSISSVKTDRDCFIKQLLYFKHL